MPRIRDQPRDGVRLAASVPTAARAVEDDSHARLRVDRHGYIRWERTRVFISTALAHENVFVDPELDAHGQRWEIRWGDVLLGWIDERRLDRGLILPSRRRRQAVRLPDIAPAGSCPDSRLHTFTAPADLTAIFTNGLPRVMSVSISAVAAP